MDAVLRLLEGLRRDELVWLNAPTRANTACDPSGEPPAAALAERVGDFNMSMDPWERTGAAPQGWAAPAPDGTTCSRIHSATTP